MVYLELVGLGELNRGSSYPLSAGELTTSLLRSLIPYHNLKSKPVSIVLILLPLIPPIFTPAETSPLPEYHSNTY